MVLTHCKKGFWRLGEIDGSLLSRDARIARLREVGNPEQAEDVGLENVPALLLWKAGKTLR